MDSPRIDVSATNSRIIGYLGRLEGHYYASLCKPDLLLQMTVPVETAVERNRARQKRHKESDAAIRARYILNRGLEYAAYDFRRVDADVSPEEMLRALKHHVWSCL